MIRDDDGNNNHTNKQSSSSTAANLALGLSNLSATCTGKYESTGLSGHIYAVISSNLDHEEDDYDDDGDDDDDDDDDPTRENPIRLVWTMDSNANNTLGLIQPSKIETTACRSNLHVPTLHFSGSMSSHVIDLFRHSIQSYVQDEISNEFCPALQTLLDPILNSYLTDIIQFLNQHLNNNNNKQLTKEEHKHNNGPTSPSTLVFPRDDQPSPQHRQQDAWRVLRADSRATIDDDDDVDDGGNSDSDLNENDDDDPVADYRKVAVQWSTEAPLLTHSLQVLNAFIDQHLQEGFLPQWLPSLKQKDNCRSCGFFFHGINGVIRALLDLQQDSSEYLEEDMDENDEDDDKDKTALWYALPLPVRLHNISFVWPGYGAIALNVSQIALAGLDQWERMQIFQTTSNDTFASRLQTRHPLQLSIRAALNVSSIPGGIFSGDQDLHEEFTITLTFRQLDWNSTLALWVDKAMWQSNVTTGILMDVMEGLWPKGLVGGSTEEEGRGGGDWRAGSPHPDIPKDSLLCLLESILDFSAPQLSLDTQLLSLRIVPTFSLNHDHSHQQGRRAVESSDAAAASMLPFLSTAEILEQDLDDLFNRALQLLIEEYPTYISSAMAGLVDGPVRHSLDAFLRRITNTSNYYDHDKSTAGAVATKNDSSFGTCPLPNHTEVPHLLNFSKVLPISHLQKFLSHEKTIRHFNKYIQCTADCVADALQSHNASGNLLEYLGLSTNKQLFADNNKKDSVVSNASDQYRLDLTGMSFDNIGQVETLKLLEPKDKGLSLSNSIMYGTRNGTTVVEASSKDTGLPQWLVQLALTLPNITATANITVKWNDLSLADTWLLHYNVNQLKSFGLARVFEHGHCLLVPVDDFQVSPNPATTATPAAANSTPRSSSFWLGLVEADVSTVVNIREPSGNGDDGEKNITLVYNLTTSKYPPVQQLVTSVLAWAASSSRDFVNLALAYSLSQASDLCAGREPTTTHRGGGGGGPEDGDDDDGYNHQELWSMVFIIATMVVLAQPALLILQPSKDAGSMGQSSRNNSNEFLQNNRVVDASLDREYTAGGFTSPLLDPGMGDIPVDTNGTTSNNDATTVEDQKAMASEPALIDCVHIPIVVRVCLPMLMLVTIFILLSSNLSVGASVELTAVIGRKTLTLPSLFEFTLFETAHEMWNAGIYTVFFLVVVFSGIWPYAKLVVMLVCFVSNRIQDGPRGRLLLAMDSLGKFSLVDTYVLVLMMVAFRYHLRFFDGDVIGLDVNVVPKYGFYGFLLATTLSLVSGHAAVYYHRMADMAAIKATTTAGATTRTTTTTTAGQVEAKVAPTPKSLLYHSFHARGVRWQLSRISQLLLLIVWAAAALLLGIGMTKKSFVFEFGGLAGIALGDENRRTAYSLISLGTSIPESSHSTAGTYVLMAVYFFYAVAAPFVCLYLLFVLLVLPMTVRQQLLVLFLAEIANAWSAVEVFCLSIVASLLEISSFASFIMGNRCDTVDEVVKDYWPSGNTDLSDANCFTVNSYVGWDAGYLIGGALLNSFVVSLTLRLVHRAMNDRVQQDAGSTSSLPRGVSFDALSQTDPESLSLMERLIGMSSVLTWLLLRRHQSEQNSDEATMSALTGGNTNGEVANGDVQTTERMTTGTVAAAQQETEKETEQGSD